jgi:hypothetical protein
MSRSVTHPDVARSNGHANVAVSATAPSDKSQSDGEYRVGPGHPPKEHQFKQGQSGNPLGAKLRKRSIAPDLKMMLEKALRQKVRDRQVEEILTKAAAGIQLLVDQFAQGDRHARRDLIHLSEKLGVDLTAGQHDAIQKSMVMALSQNDQDLVNEFVEHYVAEREAQQREEEEDNSGATEAPESKPEE